MWKSTGYPYISQTKTEEMAAATVVEELLPAVEHGGRGPGAESEKSSLFGSRMAAQGGPKETLTLAGENIGGVLGASSSYVKNQLHSRRLEKCRCARWIADRNAHTRSSRCTRAATSERTALSHGQRRTFARLCRALLWMAAVSSPGLLQGKRGKHATGYLAHMLQERRLQGAQGVTDAVYGAE